MRHEAYEGLPLKIRGTTHGANSAQNITCMGYMLTLDGEVHVHACLQQLIERRPLSYSVALHLLQMAAEWAMPEFQKTNARH